MAKDKTTVSVRVMGEKATTSMPLPEYMKVEVSPYLFAQVIHTIRRRTRIRRAHTKERAEVRGGGRKPWKQKHTGRSRHGSIRSPIWVGGGTTFGPRSRKERVLPVPMKMNRRALAGALAQHALAGTLEVVRLPKTLPTKTKEAAALVAGHKGLLVLLDPTHQALGRVLRNIPHIQSTSVKQATVTDIVSATRVWVDETGLAVLEKRCLLK